MESAINITNNALQLRGSSGYGRVFPTEGQAWNSRMFTITGGTARILRTQIAPLVRGLKLP
ncbi:acyl-CoA dehydrogenase family protein [Candidimonas nitroreducens]|uniref:Acyl-CoA dehydrogenase/oxidase C-terminal domain-containing protein n=1 Tax=Candidimonas nitroreducens TaxID=683354 RepID=A0A225MCP2_9BURK|nr:hypothetical protein CEY11_12860 [Candidimonas nitroreducens]